jgi:biphenyl 2,3-dioxygenase subunit beta
MSGGWRSGRTSWRRMSITGCPCAATSNLAIGTLSLAGRIRQINTGIHWPEEPVSPFEHIVTNVELVGVEGDEIRVNSKFFCYQNRLQDEVNHFVGRREDLLRRDPDTGFKIVKRKIIIAQNVMLPKVVNTLF